MGSPVEGLAAREAVPAEEQSAAGDALCFGEVSTTDNGNLPVTP